MLSLQEARPQEVLDSACGQAGDSSRRSSAPISTEQQEPPQQDIQIWESQGKIHSAFHSPPPRILNPDDHGQNKLLILEAKERQIAEVSTVILSHQVISKWQICPFYS